MRSRLGDDIDDFCVKCKRVMNHLVVSLLNDEPAKVRCRTCHGDHDFRHEQAPPPKVDARKAALIQQALERAAAAGSTNGHVDRAPLLPVLSEASSEDIAAAILGTAGSPIPQLPEAAGEMAAPVVAPARAASSTRKNAKAK